MQDERKQITIMFCDMVGSTALSSELDIEDYRELLRKYQITCGQIIKKYDGYIARFIGDGILIYFGYPKADETDAERAIYTALEIIETDFSIPVVNKIDVRIGIHTGEAVIGDIGELTKQNGPIASGAPPNIAARLHAYAAPNEIVVSKSTRDLSNKNINYRSIGTLWVKGISRGVSAYIVDGKKIAYFKSNEYNLRSNLFLGRQKELKRLIHKWNKVINGLPQKTIVAGEAGIGKSRLIYELIKRVSVSKLNIVQLNCSKVNKSTPYYPFIEWLFYEAGINRRASELEKKELVNNLLKRYAMADEANLQLMSRLLSTSLPKPGSFLSPHEQRSEYERLVSKLIQKLTINKPLLLIFEDAQWSDPSSIELINVIYTILKDQRLFLIVSNRNEGNGINSDDDIILGKLPIKHIQKIAKSYIGDLSRDKELVLRIAEKSDGIPLFSEEIAKSARLRIDQNNDDFTKLSSHSIPTTLRDSLASRLDRLEERKQVVEIASVLGHSFSSSLLARILDELCVDIKSDLESAFLQLQQEGVFIINDSNSPELLIRFKHQLLQETAYASLVRDVKKKYHHAAATVCSLKEFSIDPELLATHQYESGQYNNSVESLIVAAENATLHGANSESLALISRASKILQKVNTEQAKRLKPKLVTTIGITRMVSEGFGVRKAGAAYRLALQSCKKIESPDEEFRSLWGLSRYYMVSGNLSSGLEYAQKAYKIAKKIKNNICQMEALLQIGVANLWLGNFSKALINYKLASDKFTGSSNYILSSLCGEHPMVTCNARMSFPLWVMGDHKQALRACQRARIISKGVNHPMSQIRAYAFSAWVHQFMGNANLTRKYAGRVVSLSNVHDYPFWKNCGEMQIGWAEYASGDQLIGIEMYKNALQATKLTGTIGKTYHRGLLAEMYISVAKNNESREMLEDAFETASRSGDGFWSANLHRIHGELLIKENKLEEGIDAIESAILIARKQKAIYFEIGACVSFLSNSISQGRSNIYMKRLKELSQNKTDDVNVEIINRASKMLTAAV